jgi:hypothetical protein
MVGGAIPTGVSGSIRDAIAFSRGIGDWSFSAGQLTGGQHAHGSYHYQGRAADFGLAGHSVGQLKQLFAAFQGHFGSHIKELFFDPVGHYIKNGQSIRGAIGGHGDHLHIALARGGRVGKAALKSLWTRAGGSKRAADIAAAVALAESSGDPGASNRNSDGSIDRGLWQINSVHGALSTFGELANARAAVSISHNGSDWHPWTTFKTGAYRRFLSSDGGASGSRGGSGGAADPPTQLDRLTAKVDLAALTPRKRDDRRAATNVVRYWERRLHHAKASGNPRAISDAEGRRRARRHR